MPPLHPMVSFLSGWLAGAAQFRGSQHMLITEVDPAAPDAFEVTFASGVCLRVTVQEVKPAVSPKPE